MRLTFGVALFLCLTSCGQSQPQKIPDKQPDMTSRESSAESPAPAPRAVRTTVDPKSNKAAKELVRGFTHLLNGGRFDEAYMLLGPNAPPRSEFDRQFASVKQLRVRMGTAGDQESAAGSIYLSVPLTVSGDIDGKRVDQSATAIMRRVNDVSGSTEAQRRWHIERIDWKNG